MGKIVPYILTKTASLTTKLTSIWECGEDSAIWEGKWQLSQADAREVG